MWWSAARCLALYVVLPVAAPAIGLLATLATPILVVLSLLGGWAAGRAAWRGWRGQRHGVCLLCCALLSANLFGLLHQLA